MTPLQKRMNQSLVDKKLFEQARTYAFEYIDGVDEMDAFPSSTNIDNMAVFDEPLNDTRVMGEDILKQLHTFGSPATVASTGGRYFGFVTGGAVPVSLGTKWLTDVWDQCGGMYLISPINAQLEKTCQNWLVDLFGLPNETVAGFVSGTSMANFSAMAAARYHLLQKMGWDINIKGLNGAPKLRILAHEQVHSSVKKSLALLGFGQDNIEVIPSDNQGRIDTSHLPSLDNSCLVLLQASNVNTGGFDDFATVCALANKAGAWVHIDGAFGLWARASKSLNYLTKGIELAQSWATDAHKTLNTPYDSGIVLCRHPQALHGALQATGAYLNYTEYREPMYFTPEMSKRSRAIELWATMKYLGKQGIDEMVTTFYKHAKNIGYALKDNGFILLNTIVFNQVLIACDEDEKTKAVLAYVQKSGVAWMGGTTWLGKAAIRISICSWQTTTEDINKTIEIFIEAKNNC